MRMLKKLMFCSPLLLTAQAFGQEEDPAAVIEQFNETASAASNFRIDNLWILVAAFMVFMMHLGFSTLESGLTQRKNTVNILFKNVFIICMGIITYYIGGFNLMYPGFGDGEGFLKFGGFLIPSMGDMGDPSLVTPAGYELDMTTWADFLFQAMFAATAATIVSGAVAERVKLS
ncbi:MAG: ammonium transporter, partial [Verrucomicrobiales bacterium]